MSSGVIHQQNAGCILHVVMLEQWRLFKWKFARLKPEHNRMPTGCVGLDALLNGGFATGEITLLYGEASTGKTTTVIQSAICAARLGLKVLYVDADHSFSQQRFCQIAGSSSKPVSEMLMIFLPETFAEQRNLIESLENYSGPRIGLVIIDSISSLYRASFSKSMTIFSLNRDLSRQLAYISRLSSTRQLVCLVTSQVHARLAPPVRDIEPVARRTLFHFPGSILRLSNTPRSTVKEFRLERSEGSDATASRLIALTERGLEDISN